MKYLSHYLERATSMAIENAGAFWAFGQDQFNEQKKECVKYSNCGAGLVCPTENVAALRERLKKITSAAVKRDLKENGVKGVVLRELSNHECGYTGDIEPAVAALAIYGIERDEIRKLYNENRENIA